MIHRIWKLRRSEHPLIRCILGLLLIFSLFNYTQLKSEENDDPDTIVDDIISQMGLEEKVAQVFLQHYPGPDVESSPEVFGAYIFFAKDFANLSASEILQRNEYLLNSSAIAPFLAVDEEGGYVNRLSIYPELRSQPFPSPRELYLSGGLDAIAQDCVDKCNFLASLDFNVNLAPVADISTNPADFIYDRSLGEDPVTSAEYISTVVTKMREGGIVSCLKHFPGYGNNADTHSDVAYDYRPLEQFQANDFLPFKAGIEAGVPTVLLSHNVVACIDPLLPASLSKNTVRILRETLGFEGIIICDDLEMEGVQRFAKNGELAIQAFLAGNDLLCTNDAYSQFPALLEAVQNQRIPLSRLDESLRRILRLKLELGLIDYSCE